MVPKLKVDISGIFLQFFYIILNMLLVFFIANQQGILGIYNDQVVYPTHQYEFFIRRVYHTPVGVYHQGIICCYRILIGIFFKIFPGAVPGAQITPIEKQPE
jgi:hypothetical protein